MYTTPFLDLPALRGAQGELTLPGSKSISNRVLLLAGLSEGTTVVHDLLASDDTRVMLEALRALGCDLDQIDVVLGGQAQGILNADDTQRLVLYAGQAHLGRRNFTVDTVRVLFYRLLATSSAFNSLFLQIELTARDLVLDVCNKIIHFKFTKIFTFTSTYCNFASFHFLVTNNKHIRYTLQSMFADFKANLLISQVRNSMNSMIL